MRQVGDTLVWLSLIAVVAAVLYLAPRVANYVSSRENASDHPTLGVVWRLANDPADTEKPLDDTP